MDIINQPGIWLYALLGLAIICLLLLVLWFRVQLNTKKIERELKSFEDQYQERLIASQRIFMEKQEAYINEKMKELDKKEKKLEETLSNLEEDNVKKLHSIHEKFEKKINHLQEENEKESEKRLQSIQEKYEKKIKQLEDLNEKETEELKLERRKILSELEDYQNDLQQKSKIEMEKVREKYETQMRHLQDENAKLLDELHRMLDIKNKAKPSLPPAQRRFALPPPVDKNAKFSDENLNDLEQRMKTTSQEMEQLKQQFSTLEKRNKEDLALAQHEIDQLKLKIKHGDMRG